MCDDAIVSVADHQTLRLLEGRYVLERAASHVEVDPGEVLAVVRGPDGGARMRRQDGADDAWAALGTATKPTRRTPPACWPRS